MTDKVKILVVDDDPYLLDLLIETLTTIGYEAQGASNAEQALARLGQTEIQLVITDVKMPEMDGLALAARIKADYPGLPIIFISGVFTPSILQKIEGAGFISKPFRIGQLEDMIEKTVASGQEAGKPDSGVILVVDDDDSFRVMLTETLKMSGYRVVNAANAREALSRLDEGGIGAVIADVKMPGMDGIALTTQIKKDRPDIPVILITAYMALGCEPEVSLPADGFLMKPFKIESITALLENLKDAGTPQTR